MARRRLNKKVALIGSLVFLMLVTVMQHGWRKIIRMLNTITLRHTNLRKPDRFAKKFFLSWPMYIFKLVNGPRYVAAGNK